MDIIIRNEKIKSSDSEALIDIGIYFVENYNFEKQKLEFISRSEEIGDLSKLYGHVDVDVKGEVYQGNTSTRSEEHTSELQSRGHLVCRLLLEKKKIK